jgi:hypothetical protein
MTGAIQVLKSSSRSTRGARVLQRMAQYAAELYHDDDAIAYAAGVQLSPEDAEGHRKLGEMYRKKQDMPRAILELRAAISKNDKLFPVYFELAELLLSRGDTDEADRLFRRVVRAAPDEELVSQAARQSMQINLGKGSLEALEQDLLPAAIGNPRKSIIEALVELYGAMAFRSFKSYATVRRPGRRRAGAPRAHRNARHQAAFDALADDKEAQQRIAVDLPEFVENKRRRGSSRSRQDRPSSLRVQAMIACGCPGPASAEGASVLCRRTRGAGTGDPISAPPGGAWRARRQEGGAISQLLSKGSPGSALAAIGPGSRTTTPASSRRWRGRSRRQRRGGRVLRTGRARREGHDDDAARLAQGTDVPPRQAALSRSGGSPSRRPPL